MLTSTVVCRGVNGISRRLNHNGAFASSWHPRQLCRVSRRSSECQIFLSLRTLPVIMYPYQKVETADEDEGPFPTLHQRPSRARNWAIWILTTVVTLLSLTLAWGWHRYDQLCRSVASQKTEPWEKMVLQKSPYSKDLPPLPQGKTSAMALTELICSGTGIRYSDPLFSPH